MTFKNKKIQALITVALVAAILLIINMLVSFTNSHIDLTEEKRFSLTEPTKRQLRDLTDVVFVRVLLEGKFPAGFKRLQSATQDLLNDFHGINPVFEYKFEDPTEGGTPEEKKKRFEAFAEQGLVPMRLQAVDNDQKSEQIIFPFAELNYKGRKAIIKLLESQVPGQNQEEALNNSIALLEYKFSNAVQKLLNVERKNIIFTNGHDELKKEETADLEQSLRAYYNTGRINLDSVTEIPFRDSLRRVDILIVAKPRTTFSEKHKFQIDQYIMQGGKVIWLIDRLNADLAQLSQAKEIIPVEYPLNLEDMLYKYGARIQPNMIVDLEAAKIPLAVGMQGNEPQYELFKWFYHPIVAPVSNHIMVKSLDRVWFQFPASVDTIKTKTYVKKTVVLTSSKYSRTQFAPTKVDFNAVNIPEDPTKFNNGNQPIALLLEGEFPSLYENRVTQEQYDVLKNLSLEYTPLSKKTKMLIVADGDVARNEYDASQGRLLPLGFNRFMKYKFANKDFLLNAVEYMLDDKGIIEARGKDIKLRLLDIAKKNDNKTTIMAVNIVLPLLLLGIFGFVFLRMRKRRYA
jgi:ABC-2 type transport system permease protein